MTSNAKLVVIMGTQYYDGTGLGASDYPVTDLLQMLGRASRPGTDEVRWLLVFCWAEVLIKLRLLHALYESSGCRGSYAF
jgi:replicative superfamily II helicase